MNVQIANYAFRVLFAANTRPVRSCRLECSAKVTHSVDVECVLVQDASHEHRILTLAEYSLCAPRQVLGSVDAD